MTANVVSSTCITEELMHECTQHQAYENGANNLEMLFASIACPVYGTSLHVCFYCAILFLFKMNQLAQQRTLLTFKGIEILR